MIVMGFDPGGTTGWAKYDSEEDVWQRGQIDTTDHHYTLWGMLEEVQPNIIVCEKFALRNNLAANPIALEYIGVIKCFAELVGTKVFMQTPSQAKGFWTDQKLRKCNLYIPSFGHAMDATRHAMHYLMQAGELPAKYLEAQRA